jgi:hypothetical protein
MPETHDLSQVKPVTGLECNIELLPALQIFKINELHVADFSFLLG